MQRPFYGVGLLYQHDGERLTSFLGSCFCFRHPAYFITAAHCIGVLNPTDVAIAVPAYSGKDGLIVEEVWKHDSADVAILRTDDRAKDKLAPFTNVDRITDWGESVAALGFPEESHPDATVPCGALLPRLYSACLRL